MTLNERYSKLVLEAGERQWLLNQKKMEKKGVSKEAYMLGYLHGYRACFDTYDLDGEMPVVNKDKE
jgi:hypothetical protein